MKDNLGASPSSDDVCRICGCPRGASIEVHWRTSWKRQSKFGKILSCIAGLPFWLIYMAGKQTDWQFDELAGRHENERT